MAVGRLQLILSKDGRRQRSMTKPLLPLLPTQPPPRWLRLLRRWLERLSCTPRRRRLEELRG